MSIGDEPPERHLSSVRSGTFGVQYQAVAVFVAFPSMPLLGSLFQARTVSATNMALLTELSPTP